MSQDARPARDGPLVSVVIASVNGLPALADCLEALARQEGDVTHEILVVDRCGTETRAAVEGRFPHVQIVPAEAKTSIPALRAMGIVRARGRMVAILEDHCNADRRWLQAIRRAHEAGHRVIGGAVENGSVDRAVDWAVFLCEYARFMPPVRGGLVDEITGNNSVYDRLVLEDLGPALQEEVWEFFLHARLRERGVPFHCEPELLVSHRKEFGYLYFLSQRYHYSRSFAGMRLSRSPLWKRLAYASATPLLPGLLLLRILSAVARRRRWRELLRALPILCTFLLSGAWGEAMGALRGPGDSLERVE